MEYSNLPDKVFVIGANKTGTTSIKKALQQLGYSIGDQVEAELLFDHWVLRDFQPIIEYCKTADAFQDIPFSLPYTYQALDLAYPNSKFILTIRNDENEWFESLISFHSKIVNKSHPPTAEDLKQYNYRKKGFLLEAQKNIYGVEEKDPYNKTLLVNHYTQHNRQVLEYFKYRKQDLLVLNLSNKNSHIKLTKFLGRSAEKLVKMPHLNKTKTND